MGPLGNLGVGGMFSIKMDLKEMYVEGVKWISKIRIYCALL
jgi:hypothetical protein